MRIFTAVRHSIDPEFYYGGLWSGNFYSALEQLGHEIIESQVDLLPASRFMHIAGDFTGSPDQRSGACVCGPGRVRSDRSIEPPCAAYGSDERRNPPFLRRGRRCDGVHGRGAG